ncbi:hypothetical protein GBAR_LOCUS7805 [Geodia barretti]|uniref:Uncharacterized protein n=1 Tax=Geodia barretti TaxID=519541 RepID=A0AA35RIJ1_GEOBA|nr:hypothetical protein GBAR_LOCUS7805 [Geodia barretti]
MAAGPEVLLQLTPRTDELALALIPRAGDADSPGGLDASRLCSCHLYWLDSATTKKASAVYLW